MQYFISSVISSLDDDAVDGTFSDDVDGVPDEHPDVQARINMTDSQLSTLQWATSQASSDLISALVQVGKYNWQAFGAGDGVQGGFSRGSCAAYMAEYCDPAYQGRPLMTAFNPNPADKNQTLAAFLITRPPYGWIGFGWESTSERRSQLLVDAHTLLQRARTGCDMECAIRALPLLHNGPPPPPPHSPASSPWLYFSPLAGDDRQWDDLFLLQAGTPLGLCTEPSQGVFQREWSLGTASLDCNSYTAELPFQSLSL